MSWEESEVGELLEAKHGGLCRGVVHVCHLGQNLVEDWFFSNAVGLNPLAWFDAMLFVGPLLCLDQPVLLLLFQAFYAGDDCGEFVALAYWLGFTVFVAHEAEGVKG